MEKQSVPNKFKKSSVDFRLFLQSELVRRCRSNPSYSLRAFARALNVSPSALSAMLNGKRTITDKTIRRFAVALGLGPSELMQFQRDPERIRPRTEYSEFQQITLDSYAIISDWYHYAILELIKVNSFRPDTHWIAKALNLTKSEVNIAVERLKRVGLLKIKKDRSWRDTSTNGNATNISNDLSSVASRKLQKQILELSINALEEVSTDLRNHTSMTLALNPVDLPRAKEMIKGFRRELTQMLEENKNPTQIYHMNFSLYPVTQIRNGEEK